VTKPERRIENSEKGFHINNLGSFVVRFIGNPPAKTVRKAQISSRRGLQLLNI
jgi:hypothetical protein